LSCALKRCHPVLLNDRIDELILALLHLVIRVRKHNQGRCHVLHVADSCRETKAVIRYVLASNFVQLAGEADCWRSHLSSDAWSKQAAQEIWRPLTCSAFLLSPFDMALV